MGRLKNLRAFIANELRSMEDTDKRDSALLHLNGVSLAATLLAEKRGLDSELAAMAGLLRDMAAYRSGSYDDHAHRGAEYAREVLNAMGETTEEEIDQICSTSHKPPAQLVVWLRPSRADYQVRLKAGLDSTYYQPPLKRLLTPRSTCRCRFVPLYNS